MEPGRGQTLLRQLSAEEVTTLVSGLPELSFIWARLAKTNAEHLAAGRKSAVNAVRAAIMKRPDSFHGSLAAVVRTRLVDEPTDDDQAPADDALETLARDAARHVGPEMAVLLLQVLADSDEDVAPDVQLRLADLIALAQSEELDTAPGAELDDELQSEGDPGDEGNSLQTGDPLATDDPEAFDGEPADGDGSGPREEPDGQSPDAPREQFASPEQLAEIERLLEVAPGVAAVLHETAEQVERGAVPSPLPNEVSEWIGSGIALVQVGGSLRDRADAIRSAMAAAQEEAEAIHRLTDLLAGVRALEAKGLAHLVPGLLEASGFATADELVSAIAVRSGSDMAVITSPEEPVAAEPEQAPEEPHDPQTVGIDVPSEPAPGPEPESGATAEAPEAEYTPESRKSRTERPDEPTPARPEAESAQPVELQTPQSGLELAAESLLEPALPSGGQVESSPSVTAETEPVPPSPVRRGAKQDRPVKPAELVEPQSRVPSLVSPSADPWSEPTAPLLADLIRTGRERLALLIAETTTPESLGTKALKFFAAAFGIRADSLQMQLPDLVLDSSQVADLNTDEVRLLLAAASRIALDLGYSPIGSLEPLRDRAALDDHPTREVVTELSRLSARGFRRPAGPAGAAADSLAEAWQELEGSAQGLLDSLGSRSLSYQRSSKVLHFLVRENQPLGGALTKLRDLAAAHRAGQQTDADAWRGLADLARSLREPDGIERLVDQADVAVSSPQQRRHPIIANARDRLFAAIEEATDLIESGLALLARSEITGDGGAGQDATHLLSAAAQLEALPTASVGDAALLRLVGWLRSADELSLPTARLDRLVEADLAPLFEIPRDAAGRPARRPVPAELDQLVAGRDPIDVIRGYLDVGNLQAADDFIAAQGITRTDALTDQLLRAGRSLAKRHREALGHADRVVSRLRALDDVETARELAVRIEALRQPDTMRYDLSLQPLSEIVAAGEGRLAEVRGELRARVDRLPDEADSARIVALLEGGDEALAVEYLTLAEAGESLPTVEPPPGDDFMDFFPAVVRVAESAPKTRGAAVKEAREHLGAAGTPTHRTLNLGLKAWQDLTEHKQSGGGDTFAARIADVLRMVGLIPKPQSWLRAVTRTRRAGYVAYEIGASPLDRSYVPSLGTQAHGRYDLTLIWDETSPQRLLQFVEEDRRDRAHVILYFGVLTVAQRHELRRLTARLGFSPIVIDHAVAAWLSTLPEPGWRRTQRVTLPFTTLNPYTPFAGGEVPPEVFVGREMERRSITDPTGSMFVYGGRQLGKSALLRRVEREFATAMEGPAGAAEGDGRVAIYFDLNSASIGGAVPPDGLWPALAPRLAAAGVLPQGTKGPWTADTVIGAISDWLDGDSSRRLLLLLDEADNFLTADSRGVGSPGVGSFPTLLRLKGLMERSSRRFKPVFAGLHQVQRFHDLPNTPVAHGGQDILVGPLKPVDARELVQDPLHALGFAFETPETMWRLLLFTNYQASLIQMVCQGLVDHLKATELPDGGGRAVITNRHVDDVYAIRKVREGIAQRFRWTINLDPRYRVIALVTALRSFDAVPGETFQPSELQNECEYFWPDGFAKRSLSGSEFHRYLEEMLGLGVLHRQGDSYGLRSPSIRSLLGTRESIESELLEAREMLELDQGYNPTMNRRILSRGEQGADLRSPVSDADLSVLMEGAHMVVGSAALGIDRVADALAQGAAERGQGLRIVPRQALAEALADGSDDVLTAIIDPSARGEIPSALDEAGGSGSTVILIARPSTIGPSDADDERVLVLRRWSLEGLQSWPESPFSTPALRQRLKRVTGGWPSLVETTMARIANGATPEDGLSSATEEIRTAEGARAFIESAGVPVEVARTWAEWFGTRGSDGLPESSPATYEDLAAIDFGIGSHELVEQMRLADLVDETPDGWVLDRVVTEAAMRLLA